MNKLGVVVYICNPMTQKAEAEDSVSLELVS